MRGSEWSLFESQMCMYICAISNKRINTLQTYLTFYFASYIFNMFLIAIILIWHMNFLEGRGTFSSEYVLIIAK